MRDKTPHSDVALYELNKAKLRKTVTRLVDLNRIITGGEIVNDSRGKEGWENFRSNDDALEILSSVIAFSQNVGSFVSNLNALVDSDKTLAKPASALISDLTSIVASTVVFSRHLEITETAAAKTRKNGARKANQGAVNKKDRRLAIARPLILSAARKMNGKILDSRKLLDAINERLSSSNDGGQPYRSISPRTLARYVDYVRSE